MFRRKNHEVDKLHWRQRKYSRFAISQNILYVLKFVDSLLENKSETLMTRVVIQPKEVYDFSVRKFKQHQDKKESKSIVMSISAVEIK